jgi:hypothetical protein
MQIWVIVLFAAGGLATFTARAARERGRSGAGWGAISAAAAIFGLAGGSYLLGQSINGDVTSLSMVGVIGGLFASLTGPLACMFVVLALLMRLPEQVPQVSGTSWPVYRMSTKETPGSDCVLSVENGRLLLGNQTVDAKDLAEIAVDGECLKIAWVGASVHLMPKDKPNHPRTPRERARWCMGACARLRQLLDQARAA